MAGAQVTQQSILISFLVWLLKRFTLIVIVAIISGVTAGCVTYSLGTRPIRSWQLYATPAEPVTELITANEFGELYVRAATGAIYICPAHEECEALGDKEAPLSRDLCQSPRRFEPPPFPEAPIDSMELHLCGADVTLQENYVILPDGTIWNWYHGWGWGDSLMAEFASVASAILILIIGIAWLLWKSGTEIKMLKTRYPFLYTSTI